MNPQYFFCINRKCRYSQQLYNSENWFKKDGFHSTRAFGKVQRYKCRNCGKTFSDQTFSLNYYLKRKTDFKALFRQFNSNNSDCFIARENDLSFESVRIRRDRLARNALFLQSILLDSHKIDEPLAADGFESFTESKYYPTNINILMGSDSNFLYYFTESHSRRKGNTTDEQKERIKYEYRDKSFSGCTLKKQFETLIRYLKGRCKDNKCTLNTDRHTTYSSVIENLSRTAGYPDIRHIQTSSKKARNGANPLKSVNYMDRQFRKDIPNHRKDSICFARNDRNMLSRIAVYMASHNFFKPRLISDKAKQTSDKHFTCFSLDEDKVSFWKSLFSVNRFFLSKVDLPEFFLKLWKRTTNTPFKENWYSLPDFAFH